QRVDNPEANARFEQLWGMKLDKKPGLTVVEIMDAACEGKIRGMYIMGENPAMSDPNAHHARQGLAKLEHLVVQDSLRTATASLAAGVRPASAGAVTYPWRTERDPGHPVVFTENFPTQDGRGRFVPADLIPAAERPDREFPFVLITGRQLEHWHTGSMTRRASVLDAIEPLAVGSLHPLDLDAMGAKAGEGVTIASRRGEIALTARADEGTPRGTELARLALHDAPAI